MIRSTVNESIKTVERLIAGHRSESIEHWEGKDLTEAQWDQEISPTSPIHSHEHWDGTDIKR